MASTDLAKFVDDYAIQVLASSPFATQIIKKQMIASLSLSLDTALEEEAQLQSACYLSDDHREGVESFIEKRVPDFKGR